MVATLVDGHARRLGYKGLRHAANLRVGRRHAGQRAAVAADDEAAIVLFEFRRSARLVQLSGDGVEALP
jgi:hypothetical protein